MVKSSTCPGWLHCPSLQYQHLGIVTCQQRVPRSRMQSHEANTAGPRPKSRINLHQSTEKNNERKHTMETHQAFLVTGHKIWGNETSSWENKTSSHNTSFVSFVIVEVKPRRTPCCYSHTTRARGYRRLSPSRVAVELGN